MRGATIPVTDLPRALRFYGDVLGMTPTFANGEPESCTSRGRIRC